MSHFPSPRFEDVLLAAERIKPLVSRTQILNSSLLDSWLTPEGIEGAGHRIFFKAECMQRTGAFKLRGASNVLAALAEQGEMPTHVVANSSGNHAQAIAYACQEFGLPATIFTTTSVSKVKAAATEYYGADILQFDTREQADEAVKEAATRSGVLWVPPFNHPHIIAGQGTAAFEAIQDIGEVDAAVAPVGGGGLISGTLLAVRGLCPNAKVIGAEPLNANDAAVSLREGKIVKLTETPQTLADGAATPCVGELTFPFIQQLDDFYEVDEVQIAYWTQWLQHLLKIHVEPTSAMSMAAVAGYLAEQESAKRVLVILSGGNIDQAMMQRIWQTDYLTQPPML
ncbi:serine/threonine dehydratase [Aliiglaciecola sp. CAU 1673]|uniref:serine/threonine dehydratase n=1 Tax=Aliiglaciecola sp. CAU 1673 TaxID=3032595 RepID=UPI0023DBFAE5|nr:serine/threonine dehydratase [Aliiglaciecola sp. CAU 1673]MDF2176828.1 serine/threonine dehydratase [Aliiglaciecola sp. CAU 1673]